MVTGHLLLTRVSRILTETATPRNSRERRLVDIWLVQETHPSHKPIGEM